MYQTDGLVLIERRFGSPALELLIVLVTMVITTRLSYSYLCYTILTTIVSLIAIVTIVVIVTIVSRVTTISESPLLSRL